MAKRKRTIDYTENQRLSNKFRTENWDQVLLKVPNPLLTPVVLLLKKEEATTEL